MPYAEINTLDSYICRRRICSVRCPLSLVSLPLPPCFSRSLSHTLTSLHVLPLRAAFKPHSVSPAPSEWNGRHFSSGANTPPRPAPAPPDEAVRPCPNQVWGLTARNGCTVPVSVGPGRSSPRPRTDPLTPRTDLPTPRWTDPPTPWTVFPTPLTDPPTPRGRILHTPRQTSSFPYSS